MKKVVLLSLSALLFGAVSAQSPLLNGSVSGKTYKYNPATTPMFKGDEITNGPSTGPVDYRSAGEAAGSTVLGETYYDLQSNSSVCRRVLNFGNGQLTAVWTIAPDATGFPDRGTGYAHFDGTAWNPAYVTTRLENLRTGWPSINVVNGTNELIFSHDAATYTLQEGSNTTIGSNSFTFNLCGASIQMPPNNQGSIWNRSAITSDGTTTTIHVISNFADTLVIMNGVKRPFVYNKSSDGGATWNSSAILLPGYDSNRHNYGAADDYSIDANGNTVAIVQGGLGLDLTMWKSTDGGTTWSRTLVDSFEYAPDYATNPNTPVDVELPTNDGSMSVLVDNNGMVHVAYAGSGVEMSSTQGSVFFPGTIDLRYWQEGMDTAVSVPILLADVDADGNGTFDVGTATTNADGTTGPAARYGNNSILCKPSLAMDAAGDVFIVFSLPADGDSLPDGQSFRDVWVTASQDGGATWNCVQNCTRTPLVEEAFASVAKLVDANLHIVYQEDYEPGTELTNGDARAQNKIVYLPVSTAAVLSCSVGVNQPNTATNLVVSQNTPNPFSDATEFHVVLRHADNVNITVSNILGQDVLQINNSLHAGDNTISIAKGQLSPGAYFYTVKADGQSVTHKMIVE